MNVTDALEEILKEGVWVGGEMVEILWKAGEFIVRLGFWDVIREGEDDGVGELRREVRRLVGVVRGFCGLEDFRVLEEWELQFL